MNLIDEQIAIETNAHHEAKARFEKYKMRDDESFVRNAVSSNLLSHTVPIMASQIEKWWEPVATRGNNSVEHLKTHYREMALDSIGISIAALRSVFTMLFQKKPSGVTTVAESITKAIHIENSYEEFKQFGRENEDLSQQERTDWKALSYKIISDTSGTRLDQRVRVLKHARDVFTSLSDTEPTDRVKYGLAIINVLLSLKVRLRKEQPLVNLFIVKNIRSKGKMNKILLFSSEVQNYLTEVDSQLGSVLFSYYPMVVEPTPWEGMFGGGYVTPRGQGNLPLVKTPKIRLYDKNPISPEALRAINIIQGTAWQANKKVYAVMDYCSKNGMQVGGLPVKTREFVLPPRVEKEQWMDMTPNERKEVIDKRKQLHREVDSTSSKVLSLKLKLSMIRRFLKYEKLYFPHTFDFRSRVYPIASAVNPQSDKFGQALLQFSQGHEVGEEGFYWLGIHGANCWGIDSESFDARNEWIKRNEQEIFTTAENPLSRRGWWGEADDPYGFLAFCLEYGEALKLKNPFEFKSHLPVKLDATSSGLQHYSAIFRDEVGARATNLVDGERSDIYELVAETTRQIIKADIQKETDPEVIQWKRSFLNCLNRKICKGATMCLPYGISLFGVTDDLMELWADGYLKGIHLPSDPRKRMSQLRALASFILQGVGEVVRCALVGMEWLKKAEKSTLSSSNNEEVKLVTKLGFPFIQQYYKANSKRVKTFLGDVQVQLAVQKFTNRIDSRKSNTAIAPNFIHSQDATHLLKCALVGNEVGIEDFSFIHDSFGVHAAFTARFRDIIRESFVWLYSEDTLGDVRNQLSRQFPDVKIPDLPQEHFGSLDINKCLKSSYMFN